MGRRLSPVRPRAPQRVRHTRPPRSLAPPRPDAASSPFLCSRPRFRVLVRRRHANVSATVLSILLMPGIHMHTAVLAEFFEISRTAVSMCSAGILLFLVALWAAKTGFARADGLDKIVALCNLCFAIPL